MFGSSVSNRSSPDWKTGSGGEGAIGDAARPRSEEGEERQKERSGTGLRRRGEERVVSAASKQQRATEERPSVEEDAAGKVSTESGSGGSGKAVGKRKLHRETTVGSMRASRHQQHPHQHQHQQHAMRKTSDEARYNLPTSSSTSTISSSSHITTAMAIPAGPPPASSRGPSRQGYQAANNNNADKTSTLTGGSSATNSDTEASTSTKVTALPRMTTPPSPANTTQRQHKSRVDRERDAMIAEQLRESRNVANEKSLVDRLLGAGNRKKKS